MAIIRGRKVRIRELAREDVDKMQLWGQHKDPLFFHYNFPTLTSKEADQWFHIKTAKFKKKCYVIVNHDELVVGYIAIRDIRWLKRESELGIVIDPSHINSGYGTEGISLFLDYYFNQLRMLAINLRTAKYNKRAIKCYENCGFTMVKEVLEEFEDQFNKIFYNPLYGHLNKHFQKIGTKQMTAYLHMRITKEEYIQKTNSLSTTIISECE